MIGAIDAQNRGGELGSQEKAATRNTRYGRLAVRVAQAAAVA